MGSDFSSVKSVKSVLKLPWDRSWPRRALFLRAAPWQAGLLAQIFKEQALERRTPQILPRYDQNSKRKPCVEVALPAKMD